MAGMFQRDCLTRDGGWGRETTGWLRNATVSEWRVFAKRHTGAFAPTRSWLVFRFVLNRQRPEKARVKQLRCDLRTRCPVGLRTGAGGRRGDRGCGSGGSMVSRVRVHAVITHKSHAFHSLCLFAFTRLAQSFDYSFRSLS